MLRSHRSFSNNNMITLLRLQTPRPPCVRHPKAAVLFGTNNNTSNANIKNEQKRHYHCVSSLASSTLGLSSIPSSLLSPSASLLSSNTNVRLLLITKRKSSGGGTGSSNEENCVVVQGPSLVRTKVHRPNPSLMFLPGLRSLPLWTQQQQENSSNLTTTRVAYQDKTIERIVNYLESKVDIIRSEYDEIAPTLESDYKLNSNNNMNEHNPDNKLHSGTWDWHSYITKGQVQGHFGQYFPKTTEVLQELRRNNNADELLLFEGTPFGYCFFSTLHKKSSIQAHTAPMNFRLRIHLPLHVPESTTTNNSEDPKSNSCGIRVGPVVTKWVNGKALVLDDSYDHEVWNNTNENRVLLLIDIWHPDVTLEERRNIIQMFDHAKKQGWLK